MTPSNTIEELVGRVEAATGPDRKLDVALHAHFFPVSFDGSADHYAAVGYLNAADRRYVDSFVPFYSQSIDAALALLERVLPGCSWAINGGARVVPSATVWPASGAAVDADGNTSVLAIILATLRSLRIKGDHNDEA